MRAWISIWLLVGFLFTPLLAGAESSTPSPTDTATREDILGVRNEVATLRDEWKRDKDKKTAASSRPLTVGGIIQTRYSDSDEKTTAGIGAFSISQAILSFRGNLRRDLEEGRNLDYVLSFSANTQNAADFDVRLNDAYITYYLFPSLDPDAEKLWGTLGQQQKPFGLESQASDEKRPTIKQAQFASSLDLISRDIGVVLRGDLFPVNDYGFSYRAPLVEYSVGYLNGTGANKADDNENKDWVGRLVVNTTSEYNSAWRGLSLGTSLYSGEKKSGPVANFRQVEKNRVGADLSYVRTPVGFTVEYIEGEDQSFQASTGVGTVHSKGYTATVFYNFGEQFVKGYRAQARYDDWWPLTYQPFARFDRWNPDAVKATDIELSDIYTLGFNWFFAETTKLQLNLNRKDARAKNGAGTRSDEILAQFQFGF